VHNALNINNISQGGFVKRLKWNRTFNTKLHTKLTADPASARSLKIRQRLMHYYRPYTV